jgi:hypothetical protein
VRAKGTGSGPGPARPARGPEAWQTSSEKPRRINLRPFMGGLTPGPARKDETAGAGNLTQHPEENPVQTTPHHQRAGMPPVARPTVV